MRSRLKIPGKAGQLGSDHPHPSEPAARRTGTRLANRSRNSQTAFLRFEMASLYPALYRMLRKGWVEASLGDVTDRAQAALLPADEEWPSPNSTTSQKLAERSIPQWSFRRASLDIFMGRSDACGGVGNWKPDIRALFPPALRAPTPKEPLHEI